MKINKEFIDLLKKKREATVRDLLGREGLRLIVAMAGGCEKNINSLDQIDEIIYTLEFLENEKLIKIVGSDNHIIYHIGDCLKNGVKKDKIDHLFFTQELLRKHYNNRIEIRTAFFDFTDHCFPFLRYKTEKQREKIINFWLPISIAILVSVLTAIFNQIFRYNCN